GSAVSAGYGTRGADVAVSGLHDQVSFSVGHFDFRTEGFRPNNDLTQQVTNGLVQFRLKDGTSLLGEIRTAEIDRGDLNLRFDPLSYFANLRQTESFDSLRLGLRRPLSRGTLLATALIEEVDASFAFGDSFAQATSRSGSTF